MKNNKEHVMELTVYGCRGSIPTPSTKEHSTIIYGGDTTCFKVSFEGLKTHLILDCGSGMRQLGNDYIPSHVLQGNPVQAVICLTHFHHDHIQGIPFFAPLYMKQNHFLFIGPVFDGIIGETRKQVQDYLRHEQLPPFFPVYHDCMPSQKKYLDVIPGEQVLISPDLMDSFDFSSFHDKVEITTFALNHPNGACGYRVEYRGKVICFCGDHEHLGSPYVLFEKYCQDSDLLVMDAAYTEEEYMNSNNPKQGWGHGTIGSCIAEGEKLNAKQVMLSHHDPLHDDVFLANAEDKLPENFFFAKQGMVIDI